MKTSYQSIVHEGTLGTEGRVRMGFDENSIAHLMAILTDLYSDPELAVIREYSLNAWDSHRAAGNDAPIQITLPTSMAPVYTVQDFGLGLSTDDVVGHLSKYGWSSKRETNDEVGMLGLGFKAGLTYTSQFTLVAVRNGVKTTVLVTRDADGAGAVQVIDTSATDEPNGVTVQVPVKDVVDFNERAEAFFRFWDGQVLVDGAAPDSVWTPGPDDLLLDPDVVLMAHLDDDYIVQGGVPYPCGNRLSGDYRYLNAVVRVPIGSVDFTPSREALHYTERTNEVVTEAHNFINHQVMKLAQENIDEAETCQEALVRALRWRQAMTNSTFTYRGDAIPHNFQARQLHWNPRSYSAKSKAQWSCAADTALKAMLVTGNKAKGVNREHKDALKVWMSDNNIDRNLVIFTDEPLGGDWLAEVPTVSMETLRAMVPRKKKPSVAKDRSTYKLLGTDGDYRYVAELPRDKKILWVGTHEYDDRNYVVRTFLTRGTAVVLVDSKSQKRFKAENPRILHVRQYAVQLVARKLATFSHEDFVQMAHSYNWESTGFNKKLSCYDAIEDEELVLLLKIFGRSNGRPRLNEWHGVQALARWAGIPEPENTVSDDDAIRIHAVAKKYPLVAHLQYSATPQDVINYINAIHNYKESN